LWPAWLSTAPTRYGASFSAAIERKVIAGDEAKERASLEHMQKNNWVEGNVNNVELPSELPNMLPLRNCRAAGFHHQQRAARR
jgi:hypothetical protein